jgi:hypothetical protein
LQLITDLRPGFPDYSFLLIEYKLFCMRIQNKKMALQTKQRDVYLNAEKNPGLFLLIIWKNLRTFRASVANPTSQKPPSVG